MQKVHNELKFRRSKYTQRVCAHRNRRKYREQSENKKVINDCLYTHIYLLLCMHTGKKSPTITTQQREIRRARARESEQGST